MLKLEHIIQGYNVGPEYVQIVFNPRCVKVLENQFEFAEEHILDALYYHGHIALMAARDNKDPGSVYWTPGPTFMLLYHW